MNKLIGSAIALFISCTTLLSAQNPTTMVGGEVMYPQKNIVENAVNSKTHTTLVAAVQAAGLVDALKGAGPFTVFAPTNDAFKDLPDGTVTTLLKPENKAMLTKILTYHVVPERLTVGMLKKRIKAGNGVATLKTLSGGNLMVMMNGDNLMLKDENGATANITITNVFQSNGIIHVIDAVVTPK